MIRSEIYKDKLYRERFEINSQPHLQNITILSKENMIIDDLIKELEKAVSIIESEYPECQWEDYGVPKMIATIEKAKKFNNSKQQGVKKNDPDN